MLLQDSGRFLMAWLQEEKRIGEYADEKALRPRPYEALWEELAGDTLSDC